MRSLTRLLLIAALMAPSLLYAQRHPIDTGTVLEGLNRERNKIGLSPLTEDRRLSAAAESRMREMEDLEYWAHRSPDGRSPFLWLRPHGYDFNYAGENLARGFETPEILVEAWMESRGHRDNILSSNFENVGVAIIDGSTTGRAAGKSVVVLFARELRISKGR